MEKRTLLKLAILCGAVGILSGCFDVGLGSESVSMPVSIHASSMRGVTVDENNIEVITTRHAGVEYRMTTFEGAAEDQPINPDLGGFIPGLNATFESSWITINSIDFLNNPSLPTFAFFTDSSNDVFFEEPVGAVSFYYSSATGLYIEGIDDDGEVVVGVHAPANDKSGEFSIWEPVHVSVGTDDTGDNVIHKLRVVGWPGYTVIDDFQTCTVYAPPPKDPLLRIDFIDPHYVTYDNAAKTIILEMSSKWGVAKGGKHIIRTTVEFISYPTQEDAESVTYVTILGEEKDQDGYVKIQPVNIPYDFAYNYYQMATITVELFNPAGKAKGEPIEANAWILVGGGF